jgi:hypothetical protein
MSTINTPITASWTKIAETADSAFLVTWNAPVTVEVATTTANSAPTVEGHLLNNDSAITRDVIGVGYVWAKLRGSVPSTVRLVVSK